MGTARDEKSKLVTGCTFSIRHVFRERHVQQGVGAVLVFLGIVCGVTGAIFTIVAYGGTRNDVRPSFQYVGPLMLVLSAVCIVNGYILGHLDSLTKILRYYKSRPSSLYMEADDRYSVTEVDDIIGIMCLKLIMRCLGRDRFYLDKDIACQVPLTEAAAFRAYVIEDNIEIPVALHFDSADALSDSPVSSIGGVYGTQETIHTSCTTPVALDVDSDDALLDSPDDLTDDDAHDVEIHVNRTSMEDSEDDPMDCPDRKKCLPNVIVNMRQFRVHPHP